MDSRIKKHAKILVDWSLEIKKGEKVLICAVDDALGLILEVVKNISKLGAIPAVLMGNDELFKTRIKYSSTESLSYLDDRVLYIYEHSDAIIKILIPENNMSFSDIDSNKLMSMSKISKKVADIAEKKKYCETVHPCRPPTQLGMSLSKYQNIVYNSILMDWSNASKDMTTLSDKLAYHDSIRFIGHKTDIYAETKGRKWIIDDGKHNMPGGEIFTSPIENTVEGKIFFDVPYLSYGKIIEGVYLEFNKGEIVDFSVEKNEDEFKKLLEVDDGARKIGEMAMGMNNGIKEYTLDVLFDEKIRNTIHCALGQSFPECNGTNKSFIHEDIVKTMSIGEIYAGDELIYNNGKYFFEK